MAIAWYLSCGRPIAVMQRNIEIDGNEEVAIIGIGTNKLAIAWYLSCGRSIAVMQRNTARWEVARGAALFGYGTV